MFKPHERLLFTQEAQNVGWMTGLGHAGNLLFTGLSTQPRESSQQTGAPWEHSSQCRYLEMLPLKEATADGRLGG